MTDKLQENNVVLVCNDDGPNSPFLRPFLEVLGKTDWCSELRIVVPQEEQSWVSYSLTRFRPLRAKQQSFSQKEGFVVTGTPADCASLGIHNLYPSKPDVVLSGINMGWNAGVTNFLSSGTVGAATQASLSGVPAVALSVFVPSRLMQYWFSQDLNALNEHREDWERLALVACRVVERLLALYAWEHASFYSVNIPWSASEETRVVVTQTTQTYFGRIFAQTEDGQFKHQMEPVSRVEDAEEDEYPGDIATLEQEAIALTPVCFEMTAKLPQRLLQAIEEGWS